MDRGTWVVNEDQEMVVTFHTAVVAHDMHERGLTTGSGGGGQQGVCGMGGVG